MNFGHPVLNFAALLLGAFGLAYIAGFSLISLPLRLWLGGVPEAEPSVPGALGPFGDVLCKLLECPACFGFWTGAFFSFTVRGDSFLVAVWLGCAVSGSNFILGRVTRLM